MTERVEKRTRTTTNKHHSNKAKQNTPIFATRVYVGEGKESLLHYYTSILSVLITDIQRKQN